MERRFLKNWKFLILVILIFLKALQVINSSLKSKKNELYLLKKKEAKLLLIQKEAKNLTSTLKKQKQLNDLNCKTVFVSKYNESIVNEESDIQNIIFSFSRKLNIKLNSFNWGILMEDPNVKSIRYLPFSLELRGKVEDFPKFLCALLSIKKLILIDGTDFLVLNNNNFVSNLNFKLVFVDRELCRK